MGSHEASRTLDNSRSLPQHDQGGLTHQHQIRAQTGLANPYPLLPPMRPNVRDPSQVRLPTVYTQFATLLSPPPSHPSSSPQQDPSHTLENFPNNAAMPYGHLEQTHSLGQSQSAVPSTTMRPTLPTFGTNDITSVHLAKKLKLDEEDDRPTWANQKTKAGKERKRLPLACIACRSKKIRCSGEEPVCKCCARAQIPCVYKNAFRKTAPRADYLSMLESRLKRMEERVIGMVPKHDEHTRSIVPRAHLRPRKPGAELQAPKKLLQKEQCQRSSPQPEAKREQQHSRDATVGLEIDGRDSLPSLEIQLYLSEVYFDFVYGQSYLLLHKPSYMRRLRSGTLLPVLVLAVCAVSARFSTHPKVRSGLAHLRGEEWAAPAREIVLRRFDQPNLSILTATILLSLHEFGTCQGGRSWMFAGMALRMAYALQIHLELSNDLSISVPIDRAEGKLDLSSTDRELRRRTMWACFILDRFTASGTGRPMFADEVDLKIQLPIREDQFRFGISGVTQTLAAVQADYSHHGASHRGRAASNAINQTDLLAKTHSAPHPLPQHTHEDNTDTHIDALAHATSAPTNPTHHNDISNTTSKDSTAHATPSLQPHTDLNSHMGVPAYTICAIAIWGRVIKYLNLGGRDRDPHPIWHSSSGFADLVLQIDNLRASIPSHLTFSPANLELQKSQKVGNQFIFLHISIAQIDLFLHRSVMPETHIPTGVSQPPVAFVTHASSRTADAAALIADLLRHAWDTNTRAPFVGYCAFLAGTVHIRLMMTGSAALRASAIRNLAHCIQYIAKLRRYWGVLQFMIDNLKVVYRQQQEFIRAQDAAAAGQTVSVAKTGKDGDTESQAKIFQYGNWFDNAPHGLRTRQTAFDSDSVIDPSAPYFQSVEDFFDSVLCANATFSSGVGDMSSDASVPQNQSPAVHDVERLDGNSMVNGKISATPNCGSSPAENPSSCASRTKATMGSHNPASGDGKTAGSGVSTSSSSVQSDRRSKQSHSSSLSGLVGNPAYGIFMSEHDHLQNVPLSMATTSTPAQQNPSNTQTRVLSYSATNGPDDIGAHTDRWSGETAGPTMHTHAPASRRTDLDPSQLPVSGSGSGAGTGASPLSTTSSSSPSVSPWQNDVAASSGTSVSMSQRSCTHTPRSVGLALPPGLGYGHAQSHLGQSQEQYLFPSSSPAPDIAHVRLPPVSSPFAIEDVSLPPSLPLPLSIPMHMTMPLPLQMDMALHMPMQMDMVMPAQPDIHTSASSTTHTMATPSGRGASMGIGPSMTGLSDTAWFMPFNLDSTNPSMSLGLGLGTGDVIEGP